MVAVKEDQQPQECHDPKAPSDYYSKDASLLGCFVNFVEAYLLSKSNVI